MSDNSLQDAQLLLDKGDRLGARGLVAKLIASTPEDIHALHLMSTIEMDEGRLDEATALINRVIAREPDHAPAIYNLGVCQMLSGSNELALGTFQRALTINVNHSGSLYNVGVLLRQKGDLAEASKQFEHLVKVNPNWISAWEGLCETLLAERRFADVVTSCDLLARQSKSSPFLYRMRGEANLGLGDIGQAETDLIMSFRGNDKDPDTLMRLAGVFRLLGRLKDAIPLYERVLVISAQDVRYQDRFDPALGELVWTCRAAAEWVRLKVYEAQALKRLMLEGGTLHPLVAIQISEENEVVFKAAESAWPKHTFRTMHTASSERLRDTSRRARVGLLSGSFGDPVTSDVITALAFGSRRRKYDIHGFNVGPIGSAASELKSSCVSFHNLRTSAIEGLAERIAANEIDVLINMMGFEGHSLAGALSYRPVPIVANYFAFAGSMGSKHIDYLIADEVLVPSGEEIGYAESIVRIPFGSMAIWPSGKTPPGQSVRMNHGLLSGVPVFCAFAEVSAIGPDLLNTYSAILNATPNSQLWLMVKDLNARARIRNQIVARGVAGNRVVFADPVEKDDLVDRMQLADVVLDAFPLSRHAIVRAALLAGVPVVTRKGKTFASRIGASLVTSAGLPELATGDEQSFQDTAVRFATSPADAARFKSKLSSQMSMPPVFDVDRVRDYIESAIETMIERHRQGLAPASFSVPSLS
ncbi:MAG: tetratricopeptide repeat protein [Micropepsaceae bacterium]